MTLLSRLRSLWYYIMPKYNDECHQEILEELRHLRLEFTRLCEDGCGFKRFKRLKHSIDELKDSIMIAQATLDASLANLTTAVTAAAAAMTVTNPVASTPDSVVSAYQAGVDAQTVALATATPPPAPTPTPAP